MDDLHAMRCELKENFCALVKRSESEERFIEYISLTLQKNNNSNKFDIRTTLEVVLDLAFATVDQTGDLRYDNELTTSEFKLGENLEDDKKSSPLYDADDESIDDRFIFPCHVTFDDCHPELLYDYHREHLKTNRSLTQTIKYPKLCDFVIDYIFKLLKDQLSKSHSRHTTTYSQDAYRFQKDTTPEGVASSSGELLDRQLDSIVILVKKLNKVCLTEKKNCRILSKTNTLNILMDNILFLVAEIPEKQHLYLEPLLRLVFTLADYKISSHNLKQLFTLIKDENSDLKVVLTSFEGLLNHQFKILKNIQPSKSINFPTASRTAEEIESNLYITNSWHWKLRSKVIEYKRKRSRSSTSQSSDIRPYPKSYTEGLETIIAPDLNSVDKQVLNQPVTPSWLECSLIVPLSNISPLVQNNEVKFCCSMWISVCGDLLMVNQDRFKKSHHEDTESSRIDWRELSGDWLRLISRKRSNRLYRDRVTRKKSRSRRLSVKLRKRLICDKEDEEQDEKNEALRKKENNIRKKELASHELGQGGSHINLFRSGSSMKGNQTPSSYQKSRDVLNNKKSPSLIANNINKSEKPPKEFLGRRARENSQEMLMHLVSFAVDTLTIEIWLNVKCMTFCARACRIAREGQTNVIDQVTFPSYLEANGNWSHIMFNLEETYRTQHSQDKVMILKLLVDGIYKEKEKLNLGSNKNPITNFACLIGCERSTFGYVWKLSQINIYKNSAPKDIPMYLLGKGPDFWSFTNFRQQSTLPLPDVTQRSIKNLLNPKLLSLYSAVDESRALNWLTQNVVMAYVAQQPENFLDYSTSMTRASIMNPLPADHEFSNSSERFIQAKILNFSRSLKLNTNFGFGSALVEAGGIESAMICFADVVRRAHETSDVHSLAFSVLLKLSQTNQHHLSKFLDELNGLKLCEFILVHSDCIVTRSMLDYYLEFCLMRKGEYSLIKSPKLLYHLLSSWKAWHKDIRVAKYLYKKLIRLLQPADNSRRNRIRDSKPESQYISHNFKMMTNAGGIDILMSILRECLIPLDDTVQKISLDLVGLMINLISLLIKHPPGLDVIHDIMEFLVFLHHDPKAYVESITDRSTFLHSIKAKHSKSRNLSASRLRTPTSERSYLRSRDNIGYNSAGSSSDLSDSSRSTINSDVQQQYDDFRGNNSNSTSVENLAKFMRRYNHETRHRLSTMNEDEDNSIQLEYDPEKQQRPKVPQLEAQSTSEYQKCSNRNFAIANIADMLASIVKLTLKDRKKMLSEALQKPIIDANKFIILANNNSALVREKVLRLFLYCIRASYTLNLKTVLSKYEQDVKGANFKTCLPMQLMARQLLKYPTTIKMIQLCHGIIVGIDDFETFETVCTKFDIATMNNNLELNALILLMHLMTKLTEPQEIISAVRFVYAYMKQLIHLHEDDTLAVLVKNHLVEGLMRLYFACVEHEVSLSEESSETNSYHNGYNNNSSLSDYAQVKVELDRILILVTRYFIQNLPTSDTMKSIQELLTYFELMNTHVPREFQGILRDREVKLLATTIGYCKQYENAAKQRICSGRMEYYLKSFFKNNDLNTFSNTLPESQLDLDAILNDNYDSIESSELSSLEKQEQDDNRLYPKSDDSNSINSNSFENSIDDYGQVDDRKLSEGCVLERVKCTLSLAINFIVTRETGVIPSPLERRFIIKCVHLIASYLNEYILLCRGELNGSEHKCQWFLMLPRLERQLRLNFSRLILYLLSPCDSMNLDERKYYAHTLLDMFSIEQLLQLLDDGSARATYKVLLVFILDLIGYAESSLDSSENGSSEEQDEELLEEEETETKLRLLATSVEYILENSEGRSRSLNGYFNRKLQTKSSSKRATDSEPLHIVYSKFRDIWMADLAAVREDLRECLSSLTNGTSTLSLISLDRSNDDSNRVLEEALNITRDVVNDKHEQRKIYLEDLKQNKVLHYHIRQQWLSLIIGHTHERAIWFMPEHYPQSWELNPVEGPSRIRRRLRPCKLMLKQRYMRQPRRESASKSGGQVMGSQKEDEECGNPQLSTFSRSSSHSNPLDDEWYNQYSPHPLCSLVINDEQSMDFNELRIRMFTTDRIHFNCDCSIIRPNEVCEGEVSIASWCIHFIGERSDSYQRSLNEGDLTPQIRPKQKTKSSNNITVDDSGYEGKVNSTQPSAVRAVELAEGSIVSRKNQRRFISTVVEDLWFDEIVEIWDRRYQLQDVGLEIFLTNNMTYLMSFRTNRDREDFKQSLMRNQHKMINLQHFNLTTSLNRLTQLWRDGKLTNFDYLTCLNKLAGRSFNDLMQYPVFPFILSNYTSNSLDLTSPANFRKLEKPIAVQNDEKEAIFINNYQASPETNISDLPCMSRPYHYSNHYSNSATVLHFLVRLPPFTQMMIQYQGRDFDLPDRTFHSIISTWQLITRDSNSDFKELLPEFFFLPEMFKNEAQFELGRKQNDELVDDVKLPNWCPNSDARLFTLIHRQALESAYVSENLHHWIDLIFGCKQTGKAAIEAINVFHPATYYGVIDLNNSHNNSSNNLTNNINSTTIANLSAKSSAYSSDYISSDMSQQQAKSSSNYTNETDSSSKVTILCKRKQAQDMEALETMIKTYGQMPRQLFVQPLRQRSYAAYAQPINGFPSTTAVNVDNDSQYKNLEPLRQVKGLRWGSYVGSPDERDITAVRHKRIIPEDVQSAKSGGGFRKKKPKQPLTKFHLCLLPNGDIAVLRSGTSLMLDYRADRKSGGGYQLSLPTARYSRRAGLSNVARMNLFSNMIISRQQFSYIEPAFSTSSSYDTASTSSSATSSLVPSSLRNAPKAKFSPDSLSLVSWSYLDGIIRVRHPALNSQKPSVPLVQADSIVDTMSTCASIPELNLLLIGYRSGSICAHIVSTAYETAPVITAPSAISSGPFSATAAALTSSSAAPSAVHFLHTTSSYNSSSQTDGSSLGPGRVAGSSLTGDPYSAVSLAGKTLLSVRSINKSTRWLYCHSKKINCIHINVSFGIVVTGSEDGTCVIWDLNSLTYVRTIDYKLKRNSSSSMSPTNSRSDNLWDSLLDNDHTSDYLCDCNQGRSFDAARTYKLDNDNLSSEDTLNCICGSGVNLIAISDTLGDIVSVKDINNRIASSDCSNEGAGGDEKHEGHHHNNRSSRTSVNTQQTDSSDISSILYVHTINASLVGFVNCHSQVTAVCYSNAPEGKSVNVIVVGLADGLIRLYSSWDLTRVKEFHVSGISLPITSLLYSRDSQLLYITYEDSQLVVLRNRKKNSNALPKEWFL